MLSGNSYSGCRPPSSLKKSKSIISMTSSMLEAAVVSVKCNTAWVVKIKITPC